MSTRTVPRIATAVLVASAAGIPIAAATGAPHVLHLRAALKVTTGAPPACHAGVCTIRNSGTGHMTDFGTVTFTTVITADGNQPPCGPRSQWVNRIIRTIHTHKGKLVLREAGLQCPQPSVGPRVEAVWAVDGAASTGIFAAARGTGRDTAYPARNTAATRGTIKLAS